MSSKPTPDEVLQAWDHEKRVYAEDFAEALREAIRQRDILRKAVLHYVEVDRAIGGHVPEARFREVRHFGSDTASVQDFIEALQKSEGGKGARE